MNRLRHSSLTLLILTNVNYLIILIISVCLYGFSSAIGRTVEVIAVAELVNNCLRIYLIEIFLIGFSYTLVANLSASFLSRVFEELNLAVHSSLQGARALIAIDCLQLKHVVRITAFQFYVLVFLVAHGVRLLLPTSHTLTPPITIRPLLRLLRLCLRAQATGLAVVLNNDHLTGLCGTLMINIVLPLEIAAFYLLVVEGRRIALEKTTAWKVIGSRIARRGHCQAARRTRQTLGEGGS